MEAQACVGCGSSFHPRPQNKNQQYCSNHACQRARKWDWAKKKLMSDPDYRANKKSSQQRWIANNPGYWLNYRQANAEYTERNRTMQRHRDDASRLAKIDASTSEVAALSGRYRLIRIDASDLAKMDAWTVEIHSIS